jgi:hypothetical protein
MKWCRQKEKLIEDGLVADQRSRTSAAVGNIRASPMRGSLVDVLCRLPEHEYQMLKDSRIWFFTPDRGIDGWNGRIPPNMSQIIYLAPHLEEYERKDCMLIVAHEVAHAVLGHTDAPSSPELENEAWSKVIQWGFGTEEEIRSLRSRIGV